MSLFTLKYKITKIHNLAQIFLHISCLCTKKNVSLSTKKHYTYSKAIIFSQHNKTFNFQQCNTLKDYIYFLSRRWRSAFPIMACAHSLYFTS